MTFDQEGAYDDYEAERSAEALVHEYQLRGYFEADVQKTRQRFPEANYDSILFENHEGPRRQLRTVQFQGNVTFSATQLRKVIATKPYEQGILGAQDLFTSPSSTSISIVCASSTASRASPTPRWATTWRPRPGCWIARGRWRRW